MKKVLFAIPTLGGGGAERVLINLLNNLNRDKYEITLFCIFDGGINKKYLKNDIKYKYYFSNIFRGNTHYFKLFQPESLFNKMITEEYDVIVSYLEGNMTRIISGCPRNKTKLISWTHIEINEKKMLLNSYRNINELEQSYKKFDHLVFVSKSAENEFSKTFGEITKNTRVIYNTIDNEEIIFKSNEKIDDIKIDVNKINLISVGRFVEQKGYNRLLNIFSKLINNDGVNAHLYLIGEGKLKKQYIEFIEKNNLHDHVTILGYKENPYKYVKACDLFVCSSLREGYSTAVTESLIVGTPVISTLCSGMEELLGYNNEFGLITDNNETDLYQGLKEMLEDNGLLTYYTNQTLKKASTFSTSETVAKVEKLLDC